MRLSSEGGSAPGPRRARRLALLLFLGATAWSAPARAQSAQDLATARALAQQGGELFDAGRFADSIERFQRAEAFFHAPTHVLMIARGYAAKGSLVEAQEAYNKVTRETLAAGAPPAFARAKDEAQAELAQLAPRVPTLEIRVSGQGAAAAKVEVNGAVLPSAAIGIPRPVNPGEYTVVATAPGALRVEAKLTIKEREHPVKALELKPDGTAPAPPPVAPTAPSPSATPPPSASAAPTPPPASSASGAKPPPPAKRPEGDASDARVAPAVFLLGLGATGLGVGAVALGVGSGKTGDCPDGACATRADQARYDNGKSLVTMGIGALVAGGAAGIAGAVILLVGAGASDQPGAAAFVGPAEVGVRGRF